MKLRQLGEEDAEEGAGVDQEMCGIVFCVETGKNISAKRTAVSILVVLNYVTYTPLQNMLGKTDQ